MGDLTTASSTDSSSAASGAGSAGIDAGIWAVAGGGGAAAAGMAGGIGNAAEAFLTLSFIPPLSTSNSARSC